jgi:hypothetical protein
MSNEMVRKGGILAIVGATLAVVPEFVFSATGYDGALAQPFAFSLVGGLLLLSSALVLVRLLLVDMS